MSQTGDVFLPEHINQNRFTVVEGAAIATRFELIWPEAAQQAAIPQGRMERL